MIAGALIGLALNLFASERTVRVDQGLPAGLSALQIEASRQRTVIGLVPDTAPPRRLVIDASGQGEEVFESIEQLAEQEPEVAALYRRHGRSLAERAGQGCRRIGQLFLRMLQMVAVPLIMASLVCGVMGLGSHALGRMLALAVSYFLATSLLAILIGLAAVNLIRPGIGLETAAGEPPAAALESPGLGETMFHQLEALIPANPLAAIVEPNFLSLISFSILFAVFAVRVGGATARRVTAAAEAVSEVMMAITMAVIRLAPLGVFFLMIYVTATQGGDVFRSLAWYVLTVTLALLVHAAIALPLVVRYIAGVNPWQLARAMSPALLTAFSTASSSGTLPLTLSCLQQRAGLSRRTGSFVLPLGATINMDGTALFEAVAVLFIAQVHYQADLGLAQQLVVVLTALLASVGAAGIPHAGLVMMVIILQAVNLPVEMQGVILAVDRVLDMARTAVNVWSDSCGCAVVESLGGDEHLAVGTD